MASKNPNKTTWRQMAEEAKAAGRVAVQTRDGSRLLATAAQLDALEYAGRVASTWHLTHDGRLVSVPRD